MINPLNAELNPIYHLPALLEAHHSLHVSTIRVNGDYILMKVISKICGEHQFYFIGFEGNVELHVMKGPLHVLVESNGV